MAINVSNLLNKTENEGTTDAGRLTAKEWNQLVSAVGEVQTKVEGTIKGIKYNGGAENGGQTFTEIDENGYLKMTVADSSGYQLIVDIDNPPIYIAKDASCPIAVRVSSKKVEGDNYIPATAACIVNLYLNGSSTPFYTGNVYDKDYTTPGAAKELKVDLSKISGLALIPGEHENEIKIEVNNRFGTIKTDYCYVKVIELALTVDRFNKKNVYTENDKPQLIARVSGTDAYVTATVDGKEILKNSLALNGSNTNFGQTIFDSVNTHGVHTIEVIASVTREIEDGNLTISTVPQSFNYIYGTSSTTPIVMSVINNTEPEEYSNFEISFVAYKYNSTATAVTDTVEISLCDVTYNSNNQPVITKKYISTNQNVTFDVNTNSGTGKALFSLFPADGESLVGNRSIVISIGDYLQVANIEVIPSSVTLNQLSGYAVYLSANNRSNDEPSNTVRIWESTGKDKTGNPLTVRAEFDDNIEFINTGSGWIPDSDGNMAMHLRKGRFFTLNYKPFEDNPTYNDLTNGGTDRGKTISIEFATRNCLDSKSTVIKCLDNSNGNERGFIITASDATLKSNTFELGAKFKEDTRIRIDFVIEGSLTAYDYDTVSGKDGIVYKGTSNEALAIIYVDGVYQGLKVIPNSTTFIQGNSNVEASSIRFGSNDCDLDIYNIRIYDQALTPAQIVSNYSYDTPNFKDKIEIAKRNDIFDATSLSNKPNINIEKLRIARPDLPFFFVKTIKDTNTNSDEILPKDKSNWKKLSYTEWRNPANIGEKADQAEAAISWTSLFGRWRNQGTSSMSYPWPWRNWDWQLKDGNFVFADGDTSKTKWAQYKGMSDAGSISKITLKKDYASSEMCNNAITSEYFTDMALAIGGDYQNVLSPAQRLLGSVLTPYRLTFVATPCFLFQEFNNPEQSGTGGKGYEALGMMNLIPNKNECEHLGFSEKTGFTWDNVRAQSWELADNMDDWFWYKKLEGIQRVSSGADVGTYTNDVAKCYEARYPKDSTLNNGIWDTGESSDFGMVVDDKPTISAEQQAALYNEQKDIIELHNWLVDVNRQIPVDYFKEHNQYRLLNNDEKVWDWNENEDGTYNEYDTPEYRLKKFAAEAPSRLIIDQFLLYYIWRETFHAFDSGFKNLQIYTMGKATENAAYMQWGCMVRDADTTLGIENTGKDIFPPHIEDIDYYQKDDQGNINFVYGGAKGLFHNKEISSRDGHACYNGQLGSLWINLRDTYGARIAELYRALANTTKANWNSTAAINRFRKHQEKWCESLYNFGMRQYFGGEPFTTWIDSGLGDKKNSRASWLDRGFYYRNSKYNNLNDYCAGRFVCYYTPDLANKGVDHTENEPLKFKSYIPMYVGLGAHEQKMTTCSKFIRVTDTNNTYDVLPGSNGLDFGHEEGDDTVTWFFGTDQLTEIGDFARCCKVKEWQYINFPKLRELNLGHEKDRDGIEYKEYYNEVVGETTIRKERPLTNKYLVTMDCSSLKQLILLDVTNHTGLKELKLTACDQLQKLYAKGTDALKSITLPATTALNTIYLGKNLVTLNLTNLNGIQNFELEGGNSIQQLYIRNCGSYMARRSYDIMKQSIVALEEAYDEKTNNNVCILEGIDWENANSNYIERLLNINATLAGRININEGNLTNDLKVKLVTKYGNIDDENNGLYITYNKLDINSILVPSKMYLYTVGKHELSFISNPVTANTFSNATWEITNFSGGVEDEYIDIVYESNKWYLDVKKTTTNANIYAKIQLTVNQIGGYPSKTVESTVYFYERLAKPGDIVFNDGTFSDELEPGKTPIGVCFYVDPNNPKEHRLMCALNTLKTNSNASVLAWGPEVGGTYSTGGYYGTPNLYRDLEDTVIHTDDLSELVNIKVGLNNQSDNSLFADDNYRDSNNANNDYFKKFTINEAYGNIGWITTSSIYHKNISVDKIKDENGEYSNISINIGDTVPFGYYNTLAIIQNRNIILDAYNLRNSNNFIRPEQDDTASELDNLYALLESANKLSYAGRVYNGVNNTYGSLLYYPVASACFAYQPNVANLNNKFKMHNWFLPAAGDVMRIMYYIYHSYDNNGVRTEPKENSEFTNTNPKYNIGSTTSNVIANAFSNAISLLGNKFDVNSLYYNGRDMNIMTSTECDNDNAGVIRNNTGQYITNMHKYTSTNSSGTAANIIPICAF